MTGAKPEFVTDDPNLRGVYTRYQAPGAWPNGARVRKAVYQEGDATPAGTQGTIIGSLYTEDLGYGYFVEWDDKRGFAIVTTAIKLELVTAPDSRTLQ